jgi:hypothetical protein
MAEDNLDTLGFEETEYKRIEHPNSDRHREKKGMIAGLGVKQAPK